MAMSELARLNEAFEKATLEAANRTGPFHPMVPDTGGTPESAKVAQALLSAVPEPLYVPLVTPEVPEQARASLNVKVAVDADPPKLNGGETLSVPEVTEQLSGPVAAVVPPAARDVRAPRVVVAPTPDQATTAPISATAATAVRRSFRATRPPLMQAEIHAAVPKATRRPPG
jgi:hypothetical protein